MNASTPDPTVQAPARSSDLSRRRVCVTAGGLLAAALLLGGCGSNPPARPAARPRHEPARKPDPRGPEYDGYLK